MKSNEVAARYYAKEYVRGHWHVIGPSGVPIYDGKTNGNDAPVIFRDEDEAADCAERCNEENIMRAARQMQQAADRSQASAWLGRDWWPLCSVCGKVVDNLKSVPPSPNPDKYQRAIRDYVVTCHGETEKHIVGIWAAHEIALQGKRLPDAFKRPNEKGQRCIGGRPDQCACASA